MADDRRPAHQLEPDVAKAILSRLVHGWDYDDQEAFLDALKEARRLLGVAPPRLGIRHAR